MREVHPSLIRAYEKYKGSTHKATDSERSGAFPDNSSSIGLQEDGSAHLNHRSSLARPIDIIGCCKSTKFSLNRLKKQQKKELKNNIHLKEICIFTPIKTVVVQR